MSALRVSGCSALLMAALWTGGCGGDTAAQAEAAEKACLGGDKEACEKAVALLEQRCYGKDAGACTRVARLYKTGRTGRIEKARAVAAYERGCEAGDVAACDTAGAAYIRRDLAKAEQYRIKACELGSGEGCQLAASFAREREDPASKEKAKQYAERGLSLFTKACTGGDPKGCYGLGNAVRPDDEAQAQKYFREAMAIWQKSCDGGDHYGCYRVAIAYGEETGVGFDPERSRRMLEASCGAAHLDSCAELAHLFKSSDTRADDPRAAELFARACAAGIEERMPCREAGFMLSDGDGAPPDKPRAVKLLDNGCQLGDEWACFKLGTMLVEGDGVPADPARGAELTRSADGLEFRVVEVKRGKKIVDPSLTAFGIPENTLSPTVADRGQDLILVAMEARRTQATARLPVRKVYLVDASGQLFENHTPGDNAFGERPLERREFLFRVPEGARPVKVKLELGAITIALPSA